MLGDPAVSQSASANSNFVCGSMLILPDCIGPLVRRGLDELLRHADTLFRIQNNHFDSVAPQDFFGPGVVRAVPNHNPSDLEPYGCPCAHPAGRHGCVKGCAVKSFCWQAPFTIESRRLCLPCISGMLVTLI